MAPAFLLLEAPRTSGTTQKEQEKLQPSCTFTNARMRSILASDWTQPIEPTSPATNDAVSSLRLRTTITFPSIPLNGSPVKFAAHPVTYTRPCVRAARATACRDFRTASCVTQHALTTATSAS